jgi:hypothetical protein
VKYPGPEGQRTRGRSSTQRQYDPSLARRDDGRGAGVGFADPDGRKQATRAQTIEAALATKGVRLKRLYGPGLDRAATNFAPWEEVILPMEI